MKPIKITAANAAKIEAALASINGRATAHTYSTFADIELIAARAEGRLEALALPKNNRDGAAFVETSGDPVSNAYARKARYRTATKVLLSRRATGWFLESVIATEVGQAGGGRGEVYLSGHQAEIATQTFRRKFTVIL